MLDLDKYEQRGRSGYWYLKDRPTQGQTAYKLTTCAYCGRPCLVRVWSGPDHKQGFCSPECAAIGAHWLGDDATYGAKHRRLPKATTCVFGCEDRTYYDNAHYLDETGPPDEYVPMCRSCHRHFDIAIRKMQEDSADDNWRPWRHQEAA